MSRRTSKKNRFALALFIAGTALVSACGGRALIEDGSGGSGPSVAGTHSSNGGTGSAHAGSSSFAGTISVSGGTASTLGGFTSTGGTSTSFGGAVGAGGCTGAFSCPAIGCGGNSVPVIPPGQCCPICQSTCPEQPCLMTSCPPGYGLRMVSGQCCPSCVLEDCSLGMKNYAADKSQLADKYSYGCAIDTDCVAASASNACEPGCSYNAISSALISDWQSNLNNEALTECASCPTAGPPPPCVPPPVPKCVSGQCAFTR